METTEHRAVQTIVAKYNHISASLSETPKDHRPRFTRIDDQTFDIFDGTSPFCWERSTRPSFGDRSCEVMPSLEISSHPSANSERQNGKRPARMPLPSPKHSSISEPTSCQSGQSRSSERKRRCDPVNAENRGLFVALTFNLVAPSTNWRIALSVDACRLIDRRVSAPERGTMQ
jgi:hypothetical protein